jgi:hypothetical protein
MTSRDAMGADLCNNLCTNYAPCAHPREKRSSLPRVSSFVPFFSRSFYASFKSFYSGRHLRG